MNDLLADLIHLIEARKHFVVDLVNGATADGIVRMVLHEQKPSLMEDVSWFESCQV